MKNKIKIAILSLILAILISCKPKQTLTVKTEKVVDSTALVKLKNEVTELRTENSLLQSEINRFRSENSRLQSDVSSNTIKYDTSKPIIPETGKPPVLEETNTKTLSLLENQLNEVETDKKELSKENTSLTVKVTNLENQIEVLSEENEDLKSKIVPVTLWGRIKGYVWGFVVGIVVGVVVRFRVQRLKFNV